MHQLMLEPAQNYELSNCRPCRNIDIIGDGLQFLCITLWFQDRVAQTLPRLGRGHDLDDNFMPGGPSHSIHQNCASCAHSPRTYGALKKWCNAAKGPMELHFIHAALGTSGSYILCFVLHALTRCQATKCIDWECQYSMFLLCSTRFERVSGNKIDSLEVPIPSFALCFTCFERMLGDTIESLRVPPFKVSTVFVLWEDTR